MCFILSFVFTLLSSILSFKLEELVSAWWFLFQPSLTMTVAKQKSSNPNILFTFTGWHSTVSESPFLFSVCPAIYYWSIYYQYRFTESYFSMVYFPYFNYFDAQIIPDWLASSSSSWFPCPFDLPHHFFFFFFGALLYFLAPDIPSSSCRKKAWRLGKEKGAFTDQ